MLSISQLKPGTWIMLEGKPYQVAQSLHVKLGRGQGLQRVKVKNPFTGTTLERTFKGQQEIEEAEIETASATYLYKDQNGYNFMDPKSYEQFSLPPSQIGEKGAFMKEGEEVKIVRCNGQPIGIQLPTKITLKVAHTEPGFRGDTVSAPQKEARLETGATIKVPLFIKTGDTVIINTETGKYVERS
jgi:elongation factor P